MNEDAYAEWLVKRKDPVYAIPAKIGMVLVLIVTLILAMQTLIGTILLIAAAIATYFVFINLSVEFEYLFVDGDLSIDRVLGKARRKKLLDCKKEEIQIVAPADSYMLKDYEKAGMKVYDCTSRRGEAKIYALIYHKGADCVKVLMEPNDRILRSMRYNIPSKLVK